MRYFVILIVALLMYYAALRFFMSTVVLEIRQVDLTPAEQIRRSFDGDE